ncbi:uncharacterized protein LOC108923879 [Arapaima gigas]
MDLFMAAVGSGVEADAGAEHKGQSVSSGPHAASTVGRRGSTQKKFTIRTVEQREVDLLKKAESKRGQDDAYKIRSSLEEMAVNVNGGENKMKQTERPRIKGADQVPEESTKEKNDAKIGNRFDSRTNKSETKNLDKLTEVSKPVSGQVGPNSKAGQEQLPSRGSATLTDHSENWAAYRGRPQWRRVNAPNRSKSLDWGSESGTNKGKLQVQSFWESCYGRRSESLERGGSCRVERPTSTSEKVSPISSVVMSRVKMYDSTDKAEEKMLLGGFSDMKAGSGISSIRMNNSLSGKKGNSYQSLPSRIKSNQIGASEDSYTWKHILGDPVGNPGLNVGSGTADLVSGTRKAGGPLANPSILKRINKLYGSNNQDSGSNQDELKTDSNHLKDHALHNRQEVQQSETRRSSVNDDQWRSTTHNGQKGATFPRRSSERENTTSNFRNTFKNLYNEKDRRNASISSQGTFSNVPISPAEDLTSRDIEARVCKQPQLTSPDTTDSRNPTAEQQRSLGAKPGKDKVLLLRDPPLPSSHVRDKEDRGRELEKQDREQDYKICTKEKKEDGKVQGMVQNGVRRQEAEGPTVRFSTNMDSPVSISTLVSQEAFSAAGKVKEQPTEDCTDHSGGKTEAIQPVSKSLRMEEKDVAKEHNHMKDQETKPSPSRCGDNLSSDSVRNKIHRFEAMALRNQTSQLPPLRSRRAFSLQDQTRDVGGQWMKKRGLDKPLAGMKEKEAPGNDVIGKNVHHKEEGENKWLLRSFSVVEVRESRDDRYKGVSGNDAATQPIHREKTPLLHSSTTQTGPHDSLKSNPSEGSSLKVRHPDVKKPVIAQQDIAHPSEICKTSNRTASMSDKDDMTSRNVYDSTNASSVTLEKTVYSTSSNGSTKAGSTNPDNVSTGEPQASVNAQNASGPVSVAKLVPSSVDNILAILNPPGSQSEAINGISPHLNGYPIEPELHTEAAPAKKDGTISSLDVNTVRATPEEEDLIDGGAADDDDDDSTEKADDSNYDSDSGESSITITSNMSQSDRTSFSVSLAELYYFGGVEYTSQSDFDEDSEDSMSHRTASLSSDASAFSSVSLLTTEELDRLISDVRSVGDESLQSYEDVKVVVLHKEVGCGLGFTVAGGVDQKKVITVHKVFPGGLAAQEGSIQEGDQVLSINGTALRNCAHWEALRTLRRARGRSMAVVVLQKGGVDQPQTAQTKNIHRASVPETPVNEGRTLHVRLNKSSTDLGFSLEGGLDSTAGDRPVTVKKIFQGGPVNEVSPGDELLEIAGHSLRGLRRLEVWTLIKKVPPGPVDVVLRRPGKGKRERVQKAPPL